MRATRKRINKSKRKGSRRKTRSHCRTRSRCRCHGHCSKCIKKGGSHRFEPWKDPALQMGENDGFLASQKGAGLLDEIKYNIQSASNSIRGYPPPANPLAYKDQLPVTWK